MLSLLTSRPLWLGLAALILLSLLGVGLQHCRQQRNVHRLERPATAHRDSLALQAGRREEFNKVFYDLRGQTKEARLHADSSQARYDALRTKLPAVLPELSAQPARYRPGQ